MCKRTGILAIRDNFGHVVECGCGTIHMTIGPVTVSLDSGSLRTLHEMLGQAIKKRGHFNWPFGRAGAAATFHALGNQKGAEDQALTPTPNLAPRHSPVKIEKSKWRHRAEPRRKFHYHFSANATDRDVVPAQLETEKAFDKIEQ